MKNVRWISCIAVWLLFFSCQNTKESYVRKILSGVCFWDVLESDFKMDKVKFAYRLLPEGVCYKYRYNYIDNEKQISVSPIDQERGEVDIKWQVKGDSVLTMGNIDYRVLIIDKEYLLLETSASRNFILQKNCNTYIKD